MGRATKKNSRKKGDEADYEAEGSDSSSGAAPSKKSKSKGTNSDGLSQVKTAAGKRLHQLTEKQKAIGEFIC